MYVDRAVFAWVGMGIILLTIALLVTKHLPEPKVNAVFRMMLTGSPLSPTFFIFAWPLTVGILLFILSHWFYSKRLLR